MFSYGDKLCYFNTIFFCVGMNHSNAKFCLNLILFITLFIIMVLIFLSMIINFATGVTCWEVLPTLSHRRSSPVWVRFLLLIMLFTMLSFAYCCFSVYLMVPETLIFYFLVMSLTVPFAYYCVIVFNYTTTIYPWKLN